MANLRSNNLTGTGGRNAIDGSVFFSNAESDYLSVGSAGDFNFLHNGASDFTAEFWVKPGKGNDRQSVFSTGGNSSTTGFTCRIMEDGATGGSNGYKVLVQYSRGSDGNYLGFLGGTLDVGSWSHVALVFTTSNKQLAIYVNGILTNSSDLDGTANGTFGSGNFASGNSTYALEIGREPYATDLYLDGATVSNLRMVEGVTVYTATFTPPTQKLTAIDGTVLLCCQDTDDPTADASGRHEIIGFGKCYQGKRYSNIATNGDLETGDTTGWTNGGCSTFEVTTGNSHSGSYSLHCISDGNGDGVYFSAALNTTLRYKISAYMKCVGPVGTSAKAKMKVGSAFGDSTNYESQTVGYDSYKGFDKWDYVEWIGKATSATTIISFVESSANNVNDWYVDDLRVELWYPEESENILANPNFLTGATGWSFSSTPSGEFTISSNRLNVTDTGRTNDAFATQQLFAAVMAEGRYRITVDYAFATGGFDLGIGNQRIWSITGTSSATHELNAGDSNVNFRLIVGQTGAGYFNSVTLYRIAEPKRITELPPVGVDAGVTFAGETKHNTQSYMYFPTGDTSQRGRGRALFGGGYLTPSGYDGGISYLEMQSSGNTIDFGDLSVSRGIPASNASSTRGIWGGGGVPGGVSDVIDYVTINTTGNATDFGNLNLARKYFGGCGSQTRGLFGGGDTAPGAAQVDNIDYITIASAGNAADFGNLTAARQHVGACSSPTRGVWAGGGTPTRVNTIDYITIDTTGNAADFGDLTVTTMSIDGLSSNTRGLFAGGTTPTMVNTIGYITIATTGNAADFGDLITVNSHYGCTSNGIKGIWAGGYDGSGEGYNLIEFVTIATTGNAQDWGDTYRNRKYHAGCSDSHGGLS